MSFSKCSRLNKINIPPTVKTTVSYTHLDVYKRQVQRKAVIIIIIPVYRQTVIISKALWQKQKTIMLPNQMF